MKHKIPGDLPSRKGLPKRSSAAVDLVYLELTAAEVGAEDKRTASKSGVGSL